MHQAVLDTESKHQIVLITLAYVFALAALTCWIARTVTLHFMRVKSNMLLPREHRIPWFITALPVTRNLVTNDYRRLYPEGRGYRVLQVFLVLWMGCVLCFILTLLAASLSGSA